MLWRLPVSSTIHTLQCELFHLSLMPRELLFRTWSKKRKVEELSVFVKKKKKLRGIVMYTIKLGGRAIENFRWGYVSIKRTPSLWSQVSWAAGIRELHLDIYMRETHFQVLVCAQIWGGKIKGANCWMSPQESSLPHAAFLVEKGKTHQVMSLGI